LTSGPDAVVVGRLGRPHGVRGFIHARPTGATLADLRPGEVLWASLGAGGSRRLVLAEISGPPERLRLRFDGVDDRDAAAALSGAEIAVAPGRVVVPRDPDTFLVSDLLGCELWLGERRLGTIARVHAAPANDVFEVTRVDADGGAEYVPFTADAVLAVDIAGRRITVRADLLD
jgi:16S rRNA processing protein RimM